MSLSAAMIHALAHFDGTPREAPSYIGAPSFASIVALVKRGLLDDTRPRPFAPAIYALSKLGAATLAIYVEAEAVVIPWGCVRIHEDSYGTKPCCDTCHIHGRAVLGVRSGVHWGEIVLWKERAREALVWAED